MHSVPLEPLLASGLFPGDTDSAGRRDRLESLLQHAVEAATAARDDWTLDLSPEEVAASVGEGARVVREPPAAIHSNPGTEPSPNIPVRKCKVASGRAGHAPRTRQAALSMGSRMLRSRLKTP
jgi:hypothetical protein